MSELLEYSGDEMMTVAASRALADGTVCFVGIGLPSAAANLARLTHAANVVLIYESGTIETKPDILPLSIGDGELSETALTTVSVPEMFRYWLQGGRVQVGFLGAAQLDKYANINTTVIGDYDAPKVRLPGGGGAPEIATHSGEVFITLRHSKRGFVEKLDFITSAGGQPGGDNKKRCGGKGPTKIITDLCIMEPDSQTKEFIVTSMHRGVERQQIIDNTGWGVRFAEEVTTTPEPSAHELEVLRDLHRRTKEAHAGEA